MIWVRLFWDDRGQQFLAVVILAHLLIVLT
jgi:hypothetical protein